MKNQLLKFTMMVMLLITGSIFAQAPTVTSFTPTTVTSKSVVTITGTNFTNATAVKFGGTAATSFTIVNATTITAIVATGTSGAVTVTNATATATSAAAITYIAPAATPTTAAISRVLTDWNGYWSSTATSSTVADQPNNHHNLTGFKYGATIYSTGVDDAKLTTKLGATAYTAADFRALPINNISGSTGGASYLAMGSLIDGSLATATYTAPGVYGLKAKDVLIDGVKGLDLGTGVTNFSASAVLSFDVNSIVPGKMTDAEPDILITQIASPSSTADLYYFVDTNGNIVGNPISATQSSITAIGTYRLDLFTLTTGSSYSTVTPSGAGETNNTRDIRMIAFKLSEFGISTDAVAATVYQFKYIPGGDSDTAFTAYNAGSFVIAAPVITAQPVSQVICPGTGSATFSVAATGVPLSYQWKKNGVDISGATSSSYTVASTTDNIAAYSVVVTNSVGSVLSQVAYLNTLISAQPAATATCQGTATSVYVVANGLNLTYQWYSNTTASTTGGTQLSGSGATTSTYSPVVTAVGTKYYYCVIVNNGQGCAGATTSAVAVTVSAPVNAGTISASQTICSGATTTVSITGYTGTIQWQQSTDGGTTWATITGATAATYTTPALTASTQYKAVVTSGACGSLTSGIATVTVNAVSVAGTVSSNQTICSGTTATVSLTGYTGTIQWQQSGNNSTWVNATGATATTATYTTPALTAATYYRAIVTSGVCSTATSGTVTVNVNAVSVAGTVSSDQTICSGLATVLSITGSTGNIQWQQSANGATWTNAAGTSATTATYTTAPLTATTYYRAVVTSGVCNSATSGIVLVTINESNVWTGAVSTDWSTAANWACGIVPTLNHNVEIPAAPANQPDVYGITGYAKTLVLNANARLNILTGGTLQVANAVTVQGNAQFTVKNNGALLQDNNVANSGNITVIKNSNPLFRLDYTMWSSPVSDQNMLAFSPNTNGTRFYDYRYDADPTSGLMVEQYFGVPAATTNFGTAKGYLIRMPNTNTTEGYNAGTTSISYEGTFTGQPNNGDITTPLSTTGNRYTAVGNPYPSPINVTEFFAQNAGKLDGTAAIYFWRKKNNYLVSSYATLTLAGFTANRASTFAGNVNTPNYISGGQEQAGYFTGNSSNWLIAQGQGFIVRTAANPASTNLSFTNSMRRAMPATGTQAFFKSAQTATPSRLWLNLTGAADSFSQTAIAYMDEATLGLDYGYDGQQFTDGGISFYSLAADTNLAIQARPAFETTDVVPMGYVANAAGQYSIALDHVDGIFEGDQNIYIKDNTEGLMHNLKNGAYTFTTEAGTITNRFEVVYTTEALGTDSPVLSSNSVIVYKEGAAININTGTADMKMVTVYDIQGRKLYSQDNINTTQTVISGLQVQNEVLIINIETVKGKVSKKIVF